jgi:hypothetical protein
MEWIYETDATRDYRYSLGKRGEKTLLCIGVNPSQASPEQYDGTVSSVERITFHNHFDSWIMLNLYPQRSADPTLLHHQIDKKHHEENLEVIESYLEEDEVVIWAAWGNLIDSRPFLKHCLSDIFNMSQFYDCQWLSAGEPVKAGHPRHPLYLKKDTMLTKFDIEVYMETVIQPEDDRL